MSIKDTVEDFYTMPSSWDAVFKRRASAFSRGFGVADWPLCQPVRANISAEPLPTVFLIRFGQSRCAKQQRFYRLSIGCALWL